MSELPSWISQNMWGLSMLSSFFLLKVSLLFMLNIHKYVEKRRVISLFYEGVYQEVTSQAKAGVLVATLI